MEDYADDCIHLHACRRCNILTNKSHKSRQCRKEYCTAYESIADFSKSNDLFSREEVEHVKRCACNDGINGYDAQDILISDYINRK